MLYITDRTMQVSGILIPGLVKKVEVTGAAVIDAVTDDNNVTLGYQANGYEPMRVNVDVLLEPRQRADHRGHGGNHANTC